MQYMYTENAKQNNKFNGFSRLSFERNAGQHAARKAYGERLKITT